MGHEDSPGEQLQELLGYLSLVNSNSSSTVLYNIMRPGDGSLEVEIWCLL